MWLFCPNVFLFTPFAYSVLRSQKNPLEWNYRGLRAVGWVLGTKPRSFARATSILNQGSTSPAPRISS